jgi:hypothetical protein
MRLAIRSVLYLPLVYLALDEPTNAISISLLSCTNLQRIDYFPESQRPLRGLDDVTDLARSLPPPPPPMPEICPELILTSSPITSIAKPFSHAPDHVPLLC